MLVLLIYFLNWIRSPLALAYPHNFVNLSDFFNAKTCSCVEAWNRPNVIGSKAVGFSLTCPTTCHEILRQLNATLFFGSCFKIFDNLKLEQSYGLSAIPLIPVGASKQCLEQVRVIPLPKRHNGKILWNNFMFKTKTLRKSGKWWEHSLEFIRLVSSSPI